MIQTVSIDEVYRLERGRWFSRDNMRFFNSRVSHEAYPYQGGLLFVSSEKYRDAPRLYSVRYCTKEGSIKTVGEFQEFPTGRKARARIIAIITNGEPIE